tara:strand:- start:5145 stop:6353 length:1209 start_codon:yes stop_codon:yes gene_type:complete
MGNLLNALNNLKSNIFGGPGNTGHTLPPASRTQDIKMSESPTGRLGENPLSFSSFSYPSDVTNDAQNGHYMLFYVNVQNRTKYGYTSNTGKTVGNVKQEKINVWDPSGGTTKIIDVQGEGPGEKVYYRNRAKKQKGAASKAANASANTFADMSNQRQRNNRTGIAAKAASTTRITDSIAIYLPPNVQDSTTAGYNDMATGMLGYALTTGMDVKNAIGNNDIEAAAKKLAGGLKGFLSKAAEKVAAGVIEGITETEGSVEGFRRLFGEANNPYMEVLFDSMALREFTYNFTFAPRNKEETNEVQKIIQVFRFHMAPEIQGGQSRFLTLPSEFDIHYMYQSQAGIASENDYYNRISTCVLQACNVNYTPEGVKSFGDGAPTRITMSLTFKETDALTKEKISQGY